MENTLEILTQFILFNNAAGESRRQVQNGTIVLKNVNIMKSPDHIWNHHEKCFQISTNIPDIGSLIDEIDVNISEM